MKLRRSESELKEIVAKLNLEIQNKDLEITTSVNAAVKKHEKTSHEAIQAEKQKADILVQRCNDLENELNNQGESMKSQLMSLKENYEIQMK